MSFYDLKKEDRTKLVEEIHKDILFDIKAGAQTKITAYFSDEDTYIRKSSYLAIGRVYNENKNLQAKIIQQLNAYR